MKDQAGIAGMLRAGHARPLQVPHQKALLSLTDSSAFCVCFIGISSVPSL